jgi:hypothetical protein
MSYNLNMKVLVLNNFAVGQTHLGKAVFAARTFKKGDVMTQFTGPILAKKEIPKRYKGEADRYLQIDQENYMGPSGGIDDLINHSCDPNAGLRFQDGDILLIALRFIDVGEEITWDYSTTMFENGWQMKCDCRTKVCRKIIGDFMLLEPKLQLKYRKLNIIPQYIKDYMDSPDYYVYTQGIVSQGNHARKKK